MLPGKKTLDNTIMKSTTACPTPKCRYATIPQMPSQCQNRPFSKPPPPNTERTKHFNPRVKAKRPTFHATDSPTPSHLSLPPPTVPGYPLLQSPSTHHYTLYPSYYRSHSPQPVSPQQLLSQQVDTVRLPSPTPMCPDSSVRQWSPRSRHWLCCLPFVLATASTFCDEGKEIWRL